MRLTLLYGGLFLLSGVALVAVTYVLFERATEYTNATVASAFLKLPAIQRLKPASPLANAFPQLAYGSVISSRRTGSMLVPTLATKTPPGQGSRRRSPLSWGRDQQSARTGPASARSRP